MKKLIALALLLSSSLAFAGVATLEGTVKDASGKRLPGADVKVELKNGRTTAVKTDANGHYIFKELAVGNYHVTLLVNGEVKASILNTQTRSNRPTELNFDLTKAKGASKRHMVYVPTETGTHIGSGQWVEVDENGQIVDNNANVQKMNAQAVKQMQLNIKGSKPSSP